MPYEFKKEDVIGFLETNNFNFHEKFDEIELEYCPYCNGGIHGDKNTFSINGTNGAFCCQRSSCGKKGHFVELARDFEYELQYEKPRVYKRLKQPVEPIISKPEAIEYLVGRGISEEVVQRYEITVRNDNASVLIFPFFDENGILQFVKYRNTRKTKGKTQKEFSEAGTMPILFGMKQVPKDAKTLIITEGQIDALSVATAGFENVVSVPTGCNGMTWFMPCRNWLEENFNEIIVFGDNERGKVTLLEPLKSHIDHDKIKTIKAVRRRDYLGEKDANDILIKYGISAIQTAIKNAEVPKLENVKDLSFVKPIDLNKLERIPSGIAELDSTTTGFIVGQLIVLTGKRGQGKSCLMSNFICSALEAGETVFAYSGELPDFHFKNWLDFQLAGANHVTQDKDVYGKDAYHIDPESEEKISEWYRGRMYIYDNNFIEDEEHELETLCDTVEKVIKQYGCRFICIDNLMTAMEAISEKDSLYLAQSKFVGTLKKIAMKYQVVIILVAHPRKSREEFDADDVSGSSDITNKCDIILNYQRSTDNNEISILQVAKNRIGSTLRMGKEGIQLFYNPKTKRIFSQYDTPDKKYSWDKETTLFTDVPF